MKAQRNSSKEKKGLWIFLACVVSAPLLIFIMPIEVVLILEGFYFVLFAIILVKNIISSSTRSQAISTTFADLSTKTQVTSNDFGAKEGLFIFLACVLLTPLLVFVVPIEVVIIVEGFYFLLLMIILVKNAISPRTRSRAVSVTFADFGRAFEWMGNIWRF